MAPTMLPHPAAPPKPRPARRVAPSRSDQTEDRPAPAHTRRCPRCRRWLDCDCAPRESCECPAPPATRGSSLAAISETTTPVLRVEARSHGGAA